MKIAIFVVAHVLAVSAVTSSAQNVAPAVGYEGLKTLPVPVVEGDITDRPYRVIGHINASVRKATIFSGSASHEKVYRELWERGRKLGADAVIHAQYGESHITGLSWGAREARGEAIKFMTDAEVAKLASTKSVASATAETSASPAHPPN